MAKSAPAVVAFTGGEADEETLARVDRDDYPTLAEMMENVLVTSSGAMSLAPGFKHVALSPDNGLAIVRPWMFSVTTSLVLVLTDEELRFISGCAFVQVAGAAATVGNWSNQSAAPPAGGGDPIDPGTGETPPTPGVPGYAEGDFFYDGTNWWQLREGEWVFIGPYL